MKKIISIICITVLLLGLAACGQTPAEEDTPIVNPTNLTFSLVDGDDNIDIDDFPEVKEDAFIAEEGSTVLEATQLYCMSHDISISVDTSKGYVTEIAGLTEGDFSEMTGWVFTVNGEMGTLGANQQIIEEGDKIVWEFVDFSAVAW